jgi:nucleoside-diphosphate-sugar epimerase
MNAINTSKPILITGGSGYVAGWIIKLFLEKGLSVHTTVRNPSKPSSVDHLNEMAANSPGNLKIFKADLLTPGSFDAAMAGCGLVLHTASPFFISGFKDADEALVKPAKEGTQNVLAAVNRTDTVKRVVLTSSVAAIYGDTVDVRNVHNGIFTEEHWNNTSSVDHQPYNYSKTLAERKAWEICEQQNRWDLVVVNPGLVLGPSLSKDSHSESVRTIMRLSDGTFRLGVPQLWLPIVDVRDVAQAHYNASFMPEANGRHVLVAGEVTLLDISSCLQKEFGRKFLFPRRQIPKPLVWLAAPFYDLTRAFVCKNVGYPITVSNRYSREHLDMDYRPIDQTVIDHFQQILDDGLLTAAG